MKIQTIELYNWLPFKGSQKIEFPQDESSNVIIFYGENMHGKTSLINAFRWCLYGKAMQQPYLLRRVAWNSQPQMSNPIIGSKQYIRSNHMFCVIKIKPPDQAIL